MSAEKHEILTTEMVTSLFGIFDQGFEFPERQLTMGQLDCHLQSIRSLLELKIDGTDPEKTLENVWNDLLKLSITSFAPPLVPHEKRYPLDKAAAAFFDAKQKLIQNYPRSYKWAEGGCQWSDDIQNMTEGKNYDILTYYVLNQNFSIIICCSATVSGTGKSVRLSIGSIIYGRCIAILIGEYPADSVDEIDIYENFETELKNLIRVVGERMAQIRQ